MRKIRSDVKLLGYYQIIGGIIGCGTFLLLYFSNFSLINTFGSSLMLLFVLPFSFSIYAGYCCLKLRENSLFVSKINQVLQFMKFSIAGVTYQYAAGIHCYIGIDTTNEFLFIFNAGISSFSLNINSSTNTTFVAVNIVAWFLLYRIFNMEQQLEILETPLNPIKETTNALDDIL